MIDIRLQKALLSSEGKMALDLHIQIKKGEFVAICGPSGSGKTTLLRLIAGLAKPEKGKIMLHDTIWLDTEHNINLPPQKRQLGLVFQDYALFPNMSVRENLEYALRKNQSSEVVKELINVMELETLADRYPSKLSGGQQQRVALARSLVQRPGLLLLDEPLSALDPEMRLKLQNYILKVHKVYNLTILLVSHDQNEVTKMADRILNMRLGKIVSDDLITTNAFTTEKSPPIIGKIVEIEKGSSPRIILVQIGDNLVRLEANQENHSKLKPGDTILLESKGWRML